MRTLVGAGICVGALLGSPAGFSVEATTGGIPLDAIWKKQVYEFAQKNVVHSIWGISHSERNYHVAVSLGEQEKLAFEKDVIFAAAFLHDIGAIEPFRVQGVEHATRSVQVVEPLLKSFGLSDEFISKVREAILAHMYDAEVIPKSPEAILFHDADTLDFLGNIGVVRIVGLTDHHGWAPCLHGAFDTLHGWTTELPPTLHTTAAKIVAEKRIIEMNGFFETLDPYTLHGKAL